MRFLQIIRWKNLLLILLIQALVKYYLIPLFDIVPVLSHFHFLLLVLATVLIAVGGNIINDIYDLEIDKINKPNSVWISETFTSKQAKYLYFIATSLGLLLGVAVSFLTKKPQFIGLFLIPTIALYLYAYKLKKTLLVGNFLVSLLIGFSILIVALFEEIELASKVVNSLEISEVIWGLIFFAFTLNMIREIVKDVEDTIGDKTLGVVSVPIKYGKETTHLIIKGIVSMVIGVLIAIAILMYKTQPILVGYLVLAVITSLLLFINQLNKVGKLTDYKNLSTLLKLIMLVGILSIFMINLA